VRPPAARREPASRCPRGRERAATSGSLAARRTSSARALSPAVCDRTRSGRRPRGGPRRAAPLARARRRGGAAAWSIPRRPPAAPARTSGDRASRSLKYRKYPSSSGPTSRRVELRISTQAKPSQSAVVGWSVSGSGVSQRRRCRVIGPVLAARIRSCTGLWRRKWLAVQAPCSSSMRGPMRPARGAHSAASCSARSAPGSSRRDRREAVRRQRRRAVVEDDDGKAQRHGPDGGRGPGAATVRDGRPCRARTVAQRARLRAESGAVWSCVRAATRAPSRRDGAGGGTRTLTAVAGPRLLRPLRLPFRHPRSRRAHHAAAGCGAEARCDEGAPVDRRELSAVANCRPSRTVGRRQLLAVANCRASQARTRHAARSEVPPRIELG
jgi:hypothetical protein